MEKHEATFPIDSRADAHAVERVLAGLYDSVREESRSAREVTFDATETLEDFGALRDASRQTAPGRLAVVLEQRDEPFEG